MQCFTSHTPLSADERRIADELLIAKLNALGPARPLVWNTRTRPVPAPHAVIETAFPAWRQAEQEARFGTSIQKFYSDSRASQSCRAGVFTGD